MKENKESFASMGRGYQERVVQALLQDLMFAEQMADILDPEYFDLKYLEVFTRKFFEYRNRYQSFPSLDIVDSYLSETGDVNDILRMQIKEFVSKTVSSPSTEGDLKYIQESSADFCKKMSLKKAIVTCIDKLQESDYDSIQRLISDALTKGSTKDLGHEYKSGIEYRSNKNVRKPISTGWSVVDKQLNGGWERGILATFIAPTGAGKSMFLVNVGAAALAQGLNVLYVTCEMADYKIGLRFDSYFSGKQINDIPQCQNEVQAAITEKARGNLFIKEWPTKRATVQSIRALMQQLSAIKKINIDILIVDYADLLRATRYNGEKRHELESVYEDLRGLAQEFKCVTITADQTNRSGLNDEIVTLSSIAESYAKATVCDVIITISRRLEDKQSNMGRLFIAKSRLGSDGVVFPFIMNPATVKATVLNHGEDPVTLALNNKKDMQTILADRLTKLAKE